MKKLAFLLLAALSVAGCQSKKSETLTAAPFADTATVYMTQEISSEALLRVFEALGVEPQGRVAVKVSTGEPGGHNFLNPQMVKPLVDKVQGTIVECNVAYQSKRFNTETHKQVLVDHGWAAIAPCDILDGESEIKIPVRDTAHIKYDLVGAHIQNYDFLVNLAHFKGHAAGGFGGVLKNQSIGFASRDGKVYIHTAGMLDKPEGVFWTKAEQDDFLESMAAAADGVHQYFNVTKNKELGTNCVRTVYINVMNNLSVDCDCNGHPADPEMQNVGILASLDPVALDQACVDLVFNYPSTDEDNAAALIERINSRHGIHTIERAAEIGMGTRKYHLVSIDGEDMLQQLKDSTWSLVVRNRGEQTHYTQHGVRDLFALQGSRTLQGAAVADKMIGKGAAALMVVGSVRYATTESISKEALAMLQQAGVEVEYNQLLDMIPNHDKTGECPLEQRLHGIDNPQDCLPVITDFVNQLGKE